MGRLSNPPGLVPNSEGNLTTPKDLTVAGKFAANGATPQAKVADIGALNASLSLALLPEVVTALNATNKAINEIRTCLRGVGLMA